MKSMKNLLALTVFLIGGYAVAETQAILPDDSVVASEQTNVSYVSEQVSMQVDSDKVAELEVLVQKVLDDAQKPSDAKRAGVVALKELVKLVAFFAVLGLNGSYTINKACLMTAICFAADKFIRIQDPVQMV